MCYPKGSMAFVVFLLLSFLVPCTSSFHHGQHHDDALAHHQQQYYRDEVLDPHNDFNHEDPYDWKTRMFMDTSARVNFHMAERLDKLLNATETIECAEEVATSYEAFMMGHLTETLLPFESPFVQSQCPMEVPADIPEVYKAADETKLLYIIMAHQDFEQVIRLVQSLQDKDEEEGSSSSRKKRTKKEDVLSHFVIHVDGKVPLPANLLSYSSSTRNVYVMREGRVNVSWGGFSVVQATLNAISYGFFLGLPFDRVINLSGSTYPLATPQKIRKVLSHHPLNQQLMFIDPVPNVPSPRVWHYFVECDNQMHRIARFVLPHGVPLRTGSQWFIISRDFAHYLLTDDYFVPAYTAYAQHILIPDENFFATILKSSPYCHHHINTNYLYLTFDVWEDEKGDAADRKKCLQPDPTFCGRSPVLVQKKELPTAMGPGANETFLFARKFDSRYSGDVLDEIDRLLALERQNSFFSNTSSSTCIEGKEEEEGGCSVEGSISSSDSKPSVLVRNGINLENFKW